VQPDATAAAMASATNLEVIDSPLVPLLVDAALAMLATFQ
jgi:hypothetical protein